MGYYGISYLVMSDCGLCHRANITLSCIRGAALGVSDLYIRANQICLPGVVGGQDCRRRTNYRADLVVHGLALGVGNGLVQYWAFLRICLACLWVASRQRNRGMLLKVCFPVSIGCHLSYEVPKWFY